MVGMENTKLPLKHCTFIALDLETTGLSPDKSEILEIGMIKFNQESVIGTYQQLVKPSGIIPIESTNVHGITLDMLYQSPTFAEILPSFLNFIESNVLVAHNASFDLTFLDYHARKVNVQIPNLPVLCTLQLSRKYFPKFKTYKLSDLRRNLGITQSKIRMTDVKHHHEALNDSYACMEVLRKILNLQDNSNKSFQQFVHHQKGYKFFNDYK
jgi:DNA polymerase III epsilon subunit family exonuclease